jgi:uncharacterized delta-60 repeat protein
LVLSVLFQSLGVSHAWAQAGQLDPSFGAGGLVVTDLQNLGDHARDIAVQPNGKVVVAGWTRQTADPVQTDSDFAVTRYDPDGSLDSSFGVGGIVVTDFGGGSSDAAEAVVRQSDGKIVVVGWRTSFLAPGSTDGDFAVARYNTDGSLDSGFGVAGRRTTNVGGTFDAATGVVVQPDGKLVVAGRAGDNEVNTWDFGLVRYNPNGTLDASFGVGGIVLTDFNGGPDDASGVLLQTDGKIVAVGRTRSDFSVPAKMALARYNPDGSLDATFGVGGRVASFDGFVSGGALRPDGKIVVAGGSPASPGPILARFDSGGAPDMSFGTGGLAKTLTFNGAAGTAPLLQPDGKIVLGAAGGPDPDEDLYLVARYTSSGALDGSFGTDGFVASSFGDPEEEDEPEGVALQSDGKILVAGDIDDQFFGLVRYLGDATGGPGDPNLQVSALKGKAVAGAGLPYKAQDATKNAGVVLAPASATLFYLSIDDTKSDLDIQLEPIEGRPVSALAAGTINAGTTQVLLPGGTPVGKRFVIACADGANEVHESNETDNCRAKTIYIGPDLVVKKLTAPAAGIRGQLISVTDTTTNIGGAPTTVTTATRFYLSMNKKVDPMDTALVPVRSVGVLAAGSASTATTNVQIPADMAPGAYYLLANADDGKVQVESRETNNLKIRPIAIN